MASVLKKTNKHEDDEDIEALRLAALMTLRKKPVVQPASSSTVTFKPHFGNPNLIAIIPEGAEPVTHKRANFYRHHPHPHPYQGRGTSHHQYRGPTPGSHTTLKVLPQVPAPGDKSSTVQENKENSRNQNKEEEEEVSSKFRRFEDTESESEDESENEEKESNKSSDESEDVLALQDEDDSLEALMAQMEHEIEAGIDPEPNKKEKKKSKNSKPKEKEQRSKSDEKSSPLFEKTKTAIVEPTLKGDNNSLKKEGAKSTIQEKLKSPIKIYPIKINNSPGIIGVEVEKKSPPVQRRVDSPIQLSSQSPINKRSHTPPPKSPQRQTSPSTRIIRKSRSPKNVPCSRSRSPVVRTTSPFRRKSPRRLTPDRRSPMNRSPDRYYSGKRSTSPYYKPREREYVNRSRSPVRRKSLSPRRTTRDPSPRYYKRRSRSPWSPGYRHSPESPRYRSPVRRRSLSPKIRKPGYSSHSPTYRGSPKRRTSSISPRRSKSPLRKRDYSPQRRRPSPRRDYTYRRNSLSPRRKQSPPPKKYSPQRSPRRIQRSPSPRRVSPRRRISPLPVKENRSKNEQRSRTPSLSLSPSPPREAKGQNRRYKSPLRTRRDVVDTSNRISRPRRAHSPEKPVSGEGKDKRKPTSKLWEKERENRTWERKTDERKRERGDRVDRDIKKDKESIRTEKEKQEEPKDEGNLKVTDNPVFEARRKKFESTALIEPASKKIRLVSKKRSPVNERREKSLENKVEPPVEEKKIVEHSVQTEDDLFSGQEEVDEIDNFLNEDQEDVLDLSAEVWDSDEDLIPKVKKTVTRKPANKVKPKSSKKQSSEKSSSKEKRENCKISAPEPESSPPKRVAQSRTPSPEKKTGANPEEKERRDRDESDLRAELSRRREERLTKAGSLHEKLPRRLLQDAFESALGKKKTKREDKPKKNVKETKKRDDSAVGHKEKSDGRRVLVLKRQAPVKMQSAHINVTFPSRNEESESESSYTSSSSEEEERYAAAAPKRKLPVYMRLGTATTQHKRAGSRKVKLRSHRSQV